MFFPHKLVIDGFVAHLHTRYEEMFGILDPNIPGIVGWAGRLALEAIQRGDAAYHDLGHTIMVTQVGVEILRGQQFLDGGVTPHDWLNTVVALLCHDVGYVHGILPADADDSADRGDGAAVALPPGATGAALTPFHVDRGKAFIRRRFQGHRILDVEQICANIEHTRFPTPDGQVAEGYPALVRAADLIGQLADPDYLRKGPALFSEMRETGTAQKLGYANPAELRREYPSFYAEHVYPFVQDGLRCLAATQEGRQWLANLHNQLFLVEHEIAFRYR